MKRENKRQSDNQVRITQVGLTAHGSLSDRRERLDKMLFKVY